LIRQRRQFLARLPADFADQDYGAGFGNRR